MKKFIRTVGIALLFLPEAALAQLTVQMNPSVPSLVAQLQGSGVQVSNVQINCDTTAFGFFQGTSELPMTSGLALTTGHLSDIIGPSDSILANTCFNTTSGGWSELTNYLLISAAFDYCRISFTAIPIGDSLKFGYCFGSEEYTSPPVENDICGVFLTGPNPAGGQYDTLGITWVGNSNFPVCTSNVNPMVWQAYFLPNSFPPGQYFSYGASTIYMRHSIPVVPGQPYYVSMSVADAGNCNDDSGLFIDSFSSDSIATAISEISPTISNSYICILYDLSGRQVWSGTDVEFEAIKLKLPAGIYIRYKQFENGIIVAEKIGIVK